MLSDMGQILSYLEPELHNEVVLVPPLFERDHKGRSRLSKSSYDFLFCKPNLRWIFNDYLPCGLKTLLHFSPPEGRRRDYTFNFSSAFCFAKRKGRDEISETGFPNMSSDTYFSNL